ncbi:glycosyltransferase family 2 protein, partial [Candidatus Amesbacteria bacterium]|nr:glycosyltransferase family 2 protein [Candidatus Amesbacteria bacterium]
MAKTAVTPSISVVTATYDGSLSTLAECLKRVRSQNYPQKKIEIILGHGGTRVIDSLAKKFHAKVVYIDSLKQNAEYNRGVAFNRAQNDLVLILDHDNFMPTNDYLRQLVQPLLDDPQIVAVESCYFHYDRSYSPLDRYYALIGTLDPIPYYLGKADRMPQTSHSWTLTGKAIDKGKYYVVEFEPNPRKIPTVGTNGCLMRRRLVAANADVRPDYHYPIDVMVDVIRSGHNRFAFVKNSLIHLTGSRGVIPFLQRRLKFMSQYHFQDLSKRRYSVFMPGDELKLVKYIIYSLTWIKPSWDAVRGYLRI